MDLELNGKTVFISGSTSGIGFGVAQLLLQEGANVYINGRTQSSVDAAIQRLHSGESEGEVKGIPADFSKAEDVQALIQTLPEIDILINNVGIYASKSFFETSDEDWNRHMEVNVMSGVRLSRHVLPHMLEKKAGRILFISSECAGLIPSDLIAYSTTKTAILAVSRGLAQLTKGTGVTVNTIIPGSTMTEGAEQFISNLAQQNNQSPEVVEQSFFEDARPNSLLQRFATVDEVARTIVYFSSPLSSATNGASIKVDGGSMGGII